MNRKSYQVIIGDNSFLININHEMINLLKTSLSKDVQLLEVKNKNEFELDAAKINAQSIYNSLNLNGWSIMGKIAFINELMELVIKEKSNE